MHQKSTIKYILPESESIILDYTSKCGTRYQSILDKLAYDRQNLNHLLDSSGRKKKKKKKKKMQFNT
jgi:hypothetical protein